MKTQSFLFRTGTVSLLAVALMANGVQAGASSAAPASANEITDLASLDQLPPAETFRLAYEILGPGKGNYFKHRITAMKEIQAAARLSGVDVDGEYRMADEDQKKSDARIQLAKQMLERVRGRLATEQTPVLKHLDKALMQLDKALKIRAVEDEKDQAG
jgi:hypothetical protein